jgi:GH15 family glucan-1,4-alpha-glucosidase
MPAALDLAIIGNCQVAGLLDPAGSLIWACLPRPDGDPVFCALLEPNGAATRRGLFSVEVLDAVGQQQVYVRNTAIVTTLLRDAADSELRVTDFCPRFRRMDRVFRPMMFVRLLEPVRGQPRIRVRLQPCGDYGGACVEPTVGSHHLSYATAATPYRVTTDASLTALLEERPFVLGGAVAFLVGPDEAIAESPLAMARDFLARTRQYWEEWVRMLALPFDWQDAVIRAAITLKLSTYEDTGAVFAATTTSIPEAPGSGRNWDYRYCWLRDSYFVVQALNRLGATRTMEGYLRYIGNIIGNGPLEDLQPVYGLAGEGCLEERTAPSLNGYRGMAPVRIGNLAYAQRQNDVYGALVMAASQLFYDARLANPGDAALFHRLEQLGEQAANAYARPDAGPWELRGRAHVHVFSAAMCWAACERLARIASHLALHDRAAVWRRRADGIRAHILAEAWNPARRSYVATFGGSTLDATLLLLPELGLLPGSHPRFRSTLAAIERELRFGDLVFRYREEDDFGAPQFAFATCSFWYVNALAAAGRMPEARIIFERVLARRNAAGLLSEHIDPTTGEHWGNFPQTYCMVGIITSALRLSRPWEEAL